MSRSFSTVALVVALAACGKKPPPSAPAVGNSGPSPAPPVAPPADLGGDSYGGGLYGGDTYGLVAYDGPPWPAPEQPDLTGLWISACAPGDAKGEFTRLHYDLTATTWDFRADVFADATCTTRKSSFHMTGSYQVGPQSATVAGAFETRATYTARDLTADDKRTAAALGKACKVKLRPGVALDIHAMGCARLDAPPADKLCEEFDLVAITGGVLHSGARTAGADLCGPDKRPTALAPLELFAAWKPTGIPDCDALGVEYDKLATCSALPADQRAALRDA